MLDRLTSQFSGFGSDAPTMALRQMMLITRQQGVVMGFADVFLMLTVLFVAFGALAMIMRRPSAPPGAPAH
jgi:DHA2 family multidrug resistance protein